MEVCTRTKIKIKNKSPWTSANTLLVIGSNEEIEVDTVGPDTKTAMPETNGQPVIEIRTTAVCTAKFARVTLQFENIYHASAVSAAVPKARGDDDDDGEEQHVVQDASDEEEEEQDHAVYDDDDDDDDEHDQETDAQKTLQKKMEIEAALSKLNVQRVDTKRMIIHSPYLQDAINAVDNSTVSPPQLKEPYARLFHMRDDLARFRDNQPACHSEAQRATTAKHIDVLLNYLQTLLGAQCRAEERRYKQDPPMATSDLAWLLYKPHEVAYAKRPARQLGAPPQWRAFIIKSVDTDNMKMRVNCWRLVYNNGMLKREPTVFTINSFTGEQAIQELPLVPERFFPQNLAAQGGLSMANWQIKLGRQFWDLLQGPAYKEYVISDDETTDHGMDGPSTETADTVPTTTDGSNKNEYIERVVVDVTGFGKFGRPPFPLPMLPPGAHGGHDGAQMMGPNGMVPNMPHRPPQPPPLVETSMVMQFAPRCACDVCWEDPDPAPRQPNRFAEFAPAFLSSGKTPTSDLFYQVCDVEVPAFFLSKRDWAFMHLAQLRPVQTDHEAFENLVLDAEIKTTVRALVGKFAHDVKGRTDRSRSDPSPSPTTADNGRVAPWPRDIVKNKGEGRIFLLHGSPGVGKTCTAECIAELAQRPLLALTSGDISTEMHPDAVERNLDMYLRLGERYGALVLLDEADVFLEARAASDLRRNGLVSVFLRALEYFRGVLFLTTNRVETFDDAFTSRIHVALHYRPLSAESRRRVWMQHFARIERDSDGRIFVLRSAREYAYEDAEVHALALNGREIRNALQTAVALAEADVLDMAPERPDVDAPDKGKANEDKDVGGNGQVTVTETHLRAVIKMSAGFKMFMMEAKAGRD